MTYTHSIQHTAYTHTLIHIQTHYTIYTTVMYIYTAAMDPKYYLRGPKPKPRRTHTALLMAFLLLTLALLLLTFRTRAANTTTLIPSNSTTWHRNVRAVAGEVIRPFTVLEASSTGRVLNPQGLIAGDEPTVLERPSRTDEVPSVVVDFGINTVGILTIEFAGAEGVDGSLPGVRLAFSETLEHLSNNSDFTRSYNVSLSALEGLIRSSYG